MLQHRECGKPLEVDKSKPPLVAGNDLWYHVKCSGCHTHLGLLSNVESKPRLLTREEVRLESEFRNRSH